MNVEELMSAVIDEVEEGFGCLTCINAVAALIDVSKVLGQALQPLTVRTIVLNPKLTERVGDASDPGFDSQLRRWMEEEGSFRVALGIGEAPAGDWAGHLVAVGDLPESTKKIVIDPTLHQADRPTEKIVLSPMILRVDSARIQEGAHLWLRLNECGLLYSFFPRDYSFQQTPAWHDLGQRMFVRDRVLERLRKAGEL